MYQTNTQAELSQRSGMAKTATAAENTGVVSDQWLDPLSHATTSTSSNKSQSLGTPLADPCCWGQLQQSGLSGPTPT